MYKSAQDILEEEKPNILTGQRQVDICPVCGTLFVLKATLKRVGDKYYRGVPIRWSHPPALYVLNNIFHFVFRGKYIGCKQVFWGDDKVTKISVHGKEEKHEI